MVCLLSPYFHPLRNSKGNERQESQMGKNRKGRRGRGDDDVEDADTSHHEDATDTTAAAAPAPSPVISTPEESAPSVDPEAVQTSGASPGPQPEQSTLMDQTEDQEREEPVDMIVDPARRDRGSRRDAPHPLRLAPTTAPCRHRLTKVKKQCPRAWQGPPL